MSSWKRLYGCTGGFMWLYDDFYNTPKTAQYAAAINYAFGTANIPGKITNAFPANNGTNISHTVQLSWNAGANTQTHDVYFGKTNPPPFIKNQTQLSYNPGTLSLNTKYYWRIDERNSSGVTTGTIYSFTTAAVSIDNMLTKQKNTNAFKVYPNPFTYHTTIKLPALNGSEITVSVLNQYGQEVTRLVNAKKILNENVFTWAGENNKGMKVSPGFYILQVITDEISGKISTTNKKILYVR